MKRWLFLICTIVMIVSLIVFPVFAADAHGNTFVTVDDYGEISFAQDNSIVTYTMNFPSNWIRTGVWGEPWEDFYGFFSGDNFGFYRETYVTSYRMHPFGGIPGVGEDVGDQLEYCRFFDITTVPRSSTITFNFTIGVDSGLVDPPAAYRFLFFVDGNGKIVYKTQKKFKPTIDTAGSDGNTFTYTYSGTFGLDSFDVPETAVGFYPMFTLCNVECDPGYVYISYEPYTLTFPMTALEFDYIQNEKLQNTMIDVQNALAEQSEQLGDLNDKVDQLPGQIGDEMQNVADNEKAEANSSGNGSVDQMIDIVPDYSTGLLEGVRKLASAISYEGTECKLKMPALTIPALNGVTASPITFLDEQEVDFEVWFNRMPTEVMAVTKALFDLAVVGFCFYELYDLVSQLANGARKAEKVAK